MPSPAELVPIGVVASSLADRSQAPKQGAEGAPDAWLVLDPAMAEACADLDVGADIVVLTWLHLADREVLSVHPRGDRDVPRRGVLSTRSPDRPNPIGLHPVRVLAVDGSRIRVRGLEAVDGTPVLDLKPAPGVAQRPAPPPRTLARRREDTEHRLRHDVDAWVATADPASGAPYMVPLSFLWEDGHLYVATPASSPTARNLAAGQQARVGLGHTRDVVLVDATATTIPSDELDDGLAARFAEATGFDARAQTPPCPYIRMTPVRIQAWREANELAGRELMTDGHWHRA